MSKKICYYLQIFLCSGLNCKHRYKCSVVSAFLEFYHAIAQSKEGKIFSNTYTFTRMINSSALANKNIACNGGLPAKNFYTQAFAL